MAVCSEDEDAVQISWANVSGRPASSYAVENMNCNTTKPLPCVCFEEDSLFVVDCSLMNLTSVPVNIPASAQVLNLSYNKLADIPPGVFKNLARLETLDLSNNRLTSLKSGTFWGLGLLKTLNLNDNLFKMSLGTFADDVFAPLSNVTYLNLKSSFQIDNPNFQYPDLALSNLPSLETLLINGLSNRIFGEGVRKMTSLQTLDMSSTPSFRSLSKNTFVNFRNVTIRNLNLSHCNLSWIHKHAFFNLPNIDTIDYSYNQYLEIKGVGVSTYGLQNSSIKKLVFQRVHRKPSRTVVYKEDFQHLANTTLEEIHLDNNSIGILGEGIISALPLSLKVLSASWNNIQTYREQIVQLLRLRNIEKADVSYQEVYGKTFPKSPRINTHWSGLVRKAFGDPRGVLNFFSASCYENDTCSTFLKIPLPPNLWMINCSHTYKLRIKMLAAEFVNSSLKYVYLANNLLQKWIGPIKGLESLLHADLTGNNCDEVSETFFAYMTGLETLLIGKNRLGNSNHLGEKTFYNLTSLTHLDMHGNQLKTVPENLFCRLTNLTHLNLSHNYLSKLNVDISALVKLKNLDLANNSLRSLPPSLCKALDGIGIFTPIQVDVRGNDLECVCDTEYFLEWLAVTNVKLYKLNLTFCTLTNGTIVPLSANKLILNHLQHQCRKYTFLISVSSVCILLFVLIVFAGILRRHRWKLEYLFYMALNWRKKTGYQTLESTEDNPFGYDAFVSYEDADRTYIIEQVIPRLEIEAGFKLCIDKRDFIPGLYITDNILHAVQSSRKTVVLLSRKFLKSKWCMYELNMACMEGIHTGRDVLVVVLPENLPVSEMPEEIVNIIRTQTYIEMTNNRYGETLFWERLESAIRSP